MRPKPLLGRAAGSASLGGGAVTGLSSGRFSSVVTSSLVSADLPRRGPLLSFRCTFIVQILCQKAGACPSPLLLKREPRYPDNSLAGDGANAKHQVLRHVLRPCRLVLWRRVSRGKGRRQTPNSKLDRSCLASNPRVPRRMPLVGGMILKDGAMFMAGSALFGIGMVAMAAMC